MARSQTGRVGSARPGMTFIRKASGAFLVPAIVGYSLDIALVSLAGWPGSSSAFSTGLLSSDPYSAFIQTKSASFCLAFFLWFALSMRGGDRFHALLCARPTCWVFSALFMAGGLLGLLPLEDSGASTLVQALCGLLMGAGLSGNFTLWVSLFSSRETPLDARGIIGGTLLGGLLYFVLAWLPNLAICLVSILVIAPGTSLALAWCNFRLHPACHACDGEPGEVAFYGGAVTFPQEHAARRKHLKKGILSLLAPCLTIGLIGAAMQLTRLLSVGLGSSELIVGNVNSLALIASPLILLALFERSNYHVDMGAFQRVCAPLIAVVALGLPILGSWYGYVLAFVLYTIFSCASMMGILACNQVARHYRIPPVAMYALAFGIIYTMRYLPSLVSSALGMLAGRPGTGLLVTPGLEEQLWCALLCVTLMFVAYVFSDRYRRAQEAADVYSWESEIEPRYRQIVQTTEDVVRRFGESVGLTSREVEVLVPLFKGRTVPLIAEELGVTQNTVRFHCKNVYEKLGVHSKQELIALVESHMSPDAEG
ncbi:MAG: LuxR family transcriptional regulator [Coriobacteriia bacterium]|nr:LuxR family transcriptional regulator [Coriobacteriia bacterium]MBS5477179.1 LuxR family transcriptional regulator [Coriobacteriia bacterium]